MVLYGSWFDILVYMIIHVCVCVVVCISFVIWHRMWLDILTCKVIYVCVCAIDLMWNVIGHSCRQDHAGVRHGWPEGAEARRHGARRSTPIVSMHQHRKRPARDCRHRSTVQISATEYATRLGVTSNRTATTLAASGTNFPRPVL